MYVYVYVYIHIPIHTHTYISMYIPVIYMHVKLVNQVMSDLKSCIDDNISAR